MDRRLHLALLTGVLGASLLFVACANGATRAEVATGSTSAQVTKNEPSAPRFSAEALGSAPSTATSQQTAPTPEATPAPTATASSSGSTVTSGTGDIVVRARSSVNGTVYEVLCTRTGGGGQASSVAVRQQTTTENGVVKARVVLSANGTEYPVLVDGVANASALAALNSNLTNVACTVSA